VRHVIDALSARLGSPPRPIAGDALSLSLSLPPPPPWLTDDDGLNLIYDRHTDLVTHGEVALATIVMANTVLWEPGTDDAPASVVYTFDPTLLQHPHRLEQYGHAQYRHHKSTEDPPRDPWLRQIYEQLYSGLDRAMHQRLPPEETGGHPVYHSATVVFRAHLEDGKLGDGPLPVLVLRRGPPPWPCMIVPSSLWSAT